MTKVKRVPGMPGYWASRKGFIYSTKRGQPKRMVGRVDQQGRPRVTLHLSEGRKTATVSRLILLTFVGPCPKGMECCHNDGNPKNNKLDNLRWDTRIENRLDAVKHGRNYAVHSDERHPATVLTNEQVLWIRKTKARTRCSNKVLADTLGIPEVTVSRAVSGVTYRNVGGPINDTGGKLSADEVVSMRRLRSKGAKLKELADRFNVSLMTVSMVCSGKSYRTVT